MNHIIISFEKLNLPSNFGSNYKGKKIEVIETKKGILLKPVNKKTKKARGILKGCKFSTKRYLEQKQKEKDIEI